MEGSPNLIFLVLDSLRADYCSCLGGTATTPSLDGIAADGCLYTNIRSNGSWTVPATASLFTGKLPSEVGTYANSEEFDVPEEETIAGLIRSEGYHTSLVSANPWLTAEFGFDTGFQASRHLRPEPPYPEQGEPPTKDDSLSIVKKFPALLFWALRGSPPKRLVNVLYNYRKERAYADAAVMNEELERVLCTQNEPFFLFANYMDAHEPYPRVGGVDDSVEYPLEIDWHLSSLTNPPTSPPEMIRTAYQGAVEYLDRQLGKFIETLKKDGHLENSFLIVASDHGQALGEYGFWGHGNFLEESLLRVPLLVRPPDSWDQNAVPDTVDSRLSLQWLFDFLLDCATAERATDITFCPQTDDEVPVIAESHGTPQDDDISLPVNQSTRSRVFNFERGRVTHLPEVRREHLHFDSTLSAETVSTLVTKARDRSEALPSLSVTETQEIEDISKQKQQQLKNLGYM